MQKYAVLNDPALERLILKECEMWADWPRLTEEEKEETIDGYYKVAQWVLDNTKEKPNEQRP